MTFVLKAPYWPNRSTPYRAIGYSYAYRTHVFQVRKVSRYIPPNLPYRSRGEGVAGGMATQAALWRASRYTGYR